MVGVEVVRILPGMVRLEEMLCLPVSLEVRAVAVLEGGGGLCGGGAEQRQGEDRGGETTGGRAWASDLQVIGTPSVPKQYFGPEAAGVWGFAAVASTRAQPGTETRTRVRPAHSSRAERSSKRRSRRVPGRSHSTWTGGPAATLAEARPKGERETASVSSDAARSGRSHRM